MWNFRWLMWRWIYLNPHSDKFLPSSAPWKLGEDDSKCYLPVALPEQWLLPLWYTRTENASGIILQCLLCHRRMYWDGPRNSSKWPLSTKSQAHLSWVVAVQGTANLSNILHPIFLTESLKTTTRGYLQTSPVKRVYWTVDMGVTMLPRIWKVFFGASMP